MSDEPQLLIATPIRGSELFSSHVTAGYSESVRALSHMMPVSGIPAMIQFSADPVRARNRMAAMVLRETTAITHVLWWDDDQWPEDLGIVAKMMATGEDLIAAPYVNKRQPLRWIHRPLEPCPPPDGELQEVKSVGFGFTMTTRRCLERMTAAARIYTDYPNHHPVADLFSSLWDSALPDGPEDMLLSDDFSFCKRWRGLGGKVQLYLGAGIIYHAGAHAWSAREMPGGIG